MGSVKKLLKTGLGASLFVPPTPTEFGRGAWEVGGTFSVGDLKEMIPPVTIKDKAQALTMQTGAFFESLAQTNPEIPTCYLGVLDRDGKLTTIRDLVDRGDTTNLIVMKLAHVPETFCDGDLRKYRDAISSEQLQCGVADVESIFRKGFPLGSSTFEKIFKEMYGKEKGQEIYEKLATYPETVEALEQIKDHITASGISTGLEKLLRKSHLDKIPNPGYVLNDIVYNSTSKFEIAGDRDLSPDEERKFSGLDDEGYKTWTQEMFPKLARAQVNFCANRGVLNIDGKDECVAYRRKPIVTDFACTVDENRLMLILTEDAAIADAQKLLAVKEEWAIPSNKEIQRAIFRQAGVYAAINEAKKNATDDGRGDWWRDYMPAVLKHRNIDLQAVTEHSCNLMASAIGEVTNRLLGKKVFDAPPISSWAKDFLPYASKVEYQGEVKA